MNNIIVDDISNAVKLTDPRIIEYIMIRISCLTNIESNPATFPVVFPVVMSRHNVQSLCEPYHVSWKENGTRCLLYIDLMSNVFFIDTSGNIFRINNCAFLDKQMRYLLLNTLLDGQIVCSTTSTDKIPAVEFIATDALVIDGVNLCEQPFKIRWEKILTDVINPLETVIKHGSIDDHDIKVTRKEFWVASHHNVTKLLENSIDGLIFHPSNDTYISGLSDRILKWIPHEQMSIDFRAQIRFSYLEELRCHLLVEYSFQPFDVIGDMTDVLGQMDGKIIECKYDLSTGKFKFMRERRDKEYANTYQIARDMFETIRHPVTRKDLLNFFADKEKKQGL